LLELKTNRDLYLAIEKIADTYESCNRSLEQYLLALLLATHKFSDNRLLTIQEFYNLIISSFTSEPSGFDEGWRNMYDRMPCKLDNFIGWQATLSRQIVDLREMDENGTLSLDYRYFGVNSPRGSRWYNFSTIGYLECAMAGSFGGWEPGDETGRQFVPGSVGILAEDGFIHDTNPEDIDQSKFEIAVVTWEQFKDFIECGQYYE
jgi:hypothetical protein